MNIVFVLCGSCALEVRGQLEEAVSLFPPHRCSSVILATNVFTHRGISVALKLDLNFLLKNTPFPHGWQGSALFIFFNTEDSGISLYLLIVPPPTGSGEEDRRRTP